VAAYEELIAEGFDQIITITVTAKSSGTFASAQLGKDMVKGAEIKVVDSTTANMQTGYMLLEAARTIEAGGGVKEALAAIEEVKAKSCLLFTVTELEHLERSGRTVGAKEVIEAEVKVKPVVSLEGGVPHVVDKVRTDKAGIDRVIELAKERLAGSKVKGITIVQTNIPERAQRLEERLRQEFDYQGEVFINELGSAVAVHFGPGCLGMAAYGEWQK
jgi:DegV family protein with EDD domain